jgi:biotin synthase-like enzyme
MDLRTNHPPVEQGPIRPPSEAGSLLIRVMRNCPWNRCAFCRTYQGKTFSRRGIAETKEDIRRLARTAERLRARLQEADAGRARRENHPGGGPPQEEDEQCLGSVAAWLRTGGESVFLQDADVLALKADELTEIVAFIRVSFPWVRRITAYARARSAVRKTAGELERLKAAGLSRLHLGMESGSDPVLKFIRKGVTAAQQVEAGQKIREAGISLCQYVMPGLGGSRWSEEHAVQTARVLNRINPDHIRLRTLQVVPGTLLAGMVEKGEFRPLGDEAILREIQLFLGTLEGVTSEVVSDHILNLLEELEGKLPDDRGRLFEVIDRYFALPDEQRMLFRLGRRMGVYRRLDDLAEQTARCRLMGLLEGYRGDPLRLEADLATLRSRYI